MPQLWSPPSGPLVKIDIHAHFFPLLSREQATSSLGREDAAWLRDNGDGTGHLMTRGEPYRPVEQRLWDPDTRVAEMDRQGVDVQVISATPILFNYSGDAAATARWAATINDMAAEMAARHPNRLKALCQVPLQDPELACIEVSRAMANGHVGVHLGNHVSGRYLDDPDLLRFLRHCANENIPVLVHPWDTMAPDRMPKYMLAWLVGMPAETHLSILSLILSGGFERLPSELRLCFAHGGGNFAFQLARADNAWHRRDIIRKDCPHPPSHYVDRFSVDSAVFGDEQLRLLVDVMGDDRVLLGSDFPFPLGEEFPGQLVDGNPYLSDDAKDKIRHRNAAAFFDLEVA